MPMYSTALLFRVSKLVSIAAIGIMGLIIVFGNVTDYYTNYDFVAHVMKMDTVFPESNIDYRKVTNPLFFHMVYILLITLEGLMTFFCLKGSYVLLKAVKRDAKTFNKSKNWAVAGLIIGISIWFFGFQVVGGEWFAMWQSSSWNGLSSADRVVTFLVLILILFQFQDEELPSEQEFKSNYK